MTDFVFQYQHIGEYQNTTGYNVEELFNKFAFEVPIYQRVFTWREEQFERLFNDLKNHFAGQNNEAYYLGIITVVHAQNSPKLILVDGQQRLTCIILLGALLGWNLDITKLTYTARETDEAAIKQVYDICKNPNDVIDKIDMVSNVSMAEFLRFALTPGKGSECLKVLRNKAQDIKQQLTLMVSILPEAPYKDNIFEQNRYFEKMNYGGKQLEPCEILKVKMCRGLEIHYIDIWNAVSNFGRHYVSHENSTVQRNSGISLSKVLRGQSNNDNDSQQDKELLTRIYTECKKQLDKYEFDSEEQDDLRKAPISFSTFLLHVRYLYLNSNDRQIGDEDQLLKLFSDICLRPPKDRECFINLMKSYRQFLDSEIIHIKAVDNESLYYFYAATENGEFYDSIPESKKEMMQFQSMLYVSSDNNQIWLLDAYRKYQEEGNLVVQTLKQIMSDVILNKDIKNALINAQHGWPAECLRYGSNNSRWLALLDYLLWEYFNSNEEREMSKHFVCDKFKPYNGQLRSAIRNYVFRKNRSVEHMHAQTDSNATDANNWQDDKDFFGNLALISAGRNSEYGNMPVGGKFDRVVKLLTDGGLNGSKIESIKLLLMLDKCNGEEVKWTVDKSKEHANEMLSILQNFLKTPQ